MSMVCQQCNTAYAQRLHCPSCGARLTYQETPRGSSGEGGSSGSWLHTPFGRIVVGLLVAQGLFFCLQYLCTAGLLAVQDQEAAANAWGTLSGLLLLQAMQVVGLLAGGALAGASQRLGVLYGAVVGALSGVVFVLFAGVHGQALNPVLVYGQPLVQTAFGALGGVVGCLIWRPAASLSLLAPGRNPSRPVRRPQQSMFHGPIVWWRVGIGSILGAAGLMAAAIVLENVLHYSNGKFKVTTNTEANLLTWEISALAILIGSAFAAAGSKNGLKQGLCVGIGIGVVLIGFTLGGFGVPPGSPGVDPSKLLLDVTSSIALALGGGWFGGHLFPHIPAHLRQRRHGPTP